ncbi:hypothetical protein Tco_1074602, partial [Tanacetum coccineum]
GKENGVNILKSIDEGPFQMGTFRDTIAEGNKGAFHLGPERPRVYTNLSPKDKNRMQVNSKFVNNILPEWGRFVTVVKLNRGLRDSNYDQLVDRIEVKQDRLSATTAMENGVALDEEQLLFIAGGQDTIVDEDVDEQPVQDLALNVDNIFQADDCDAFDSDVDEAPTVQTMFMANLSSADPVYDKASPSCDSDILSEVPDHDNYQDAIYEHHEAHEMHDYVQLNYVVDSHAAYTSDSNMIPYDQLPNVSLRAKFELNEKEQKIEEQLRIIITDRNIKEENLKKELHSVKMKLTSTINHNKSMVEEVKSLKTDFQQKENKYLEEFFDMKALKEKVEDRLFKQDQSVQTVHMLCKPKPHYDDQRKVAIGYENPLYLTRALQVQPALYNGHEFLKSTHVSVIVHNSEDTLELAEITKKKINAKMKTPLWTEKNINIRPLNYSKANYLATFTPQTQLTPEQRFWSNDLIKIHAKALNAKAKSTNLNRAMAVYHPNTPAKLVPKVLPTKSQVQVNIYSLVQLFLESDKTCKKRITPTRLTEGERGFEQTKTCYLTEVEVDQHAIDKKRDEIEQKNLLIENENLIADCLSKYVFYTATAYVLTVSRFSDMHDAFTAAQKRIAELESENSNMKNKIQNDDNEVMIKHFSKLEVEHLNLQLKYQHLKDRFGNKKSVTSSDAPTFDSVYVIGQLKEQVQSRGNMVRELKEKISRLTKKHSDADLILDLKALDSQNKDLTAKVNALHDLNEHFRAENEKVKQHYKELYDIIKITRTKTIEKTNSLLTEIENLKAQIKGKSKCVTMPAKKPKVYAPGRYDIDVESIPSRNRNNREVHLDYLKHLKESVETLHEIVEEAKVVRPLDSSLASACLYTKHS